MLAADAQLNLWASFLTFLDGDFHELADARLVDGSKRIACDDLQFLIGTEKGAGIVPAHSEGGLCEVVRAETEKLSRLSNFVGGQGAARHFNHGANEVTEFNLLLRHHLSGNAMNDFDLEIQFALESNQGNHDFRFDLDSFFQNFGCCFKNGASLHFG